MGQVVNTNGDYAIKVGEGNRITLDTGTGIGSVRVTGNLIVEGDTLTVSAENLNVADNIIIVNYGETGSGVTLEYSGIQVDRGTATAASLVYDEAADSWLIGHGTAPGPFNYSDSKLRVTKILTNADTDQGDLTLIGTGTGVVKVFGTTNYEDQVTHDDDIPNKKYVDDSIQNNPTYQIVRNNTRVVTFDVDDPLDPLLNFPPAVGPYTSQPGESLVGIVVDDQIVASFYQTRIEMKGLTLFTEDPSPFNPLIPDAIVLQATNTDANIKLETNGTGKVETSYAVQMNRISATPAYVDNAVLLHSKDPEEGDTGLYYVHSATRNGELISKNRALVFSMIF